MAERPLPLILLALLLALCAGCGGSGAPQPATGGNGPGGQAGLPGLPPGDAPGSVNRQASAYLFQEADLYDSASASMFGPDLSLSPSPLSYAILGVNTGGQYPPSVTIGGTLSGLYVGVSNYAANRWEWLDGPLNAAGTVSLPATGTLSPGGSIYLVFACPNGNSAEITADLDINAPADAWNFMVWIAGDNNLAANAVDNLNDMETVGSTDDLRLLVGYDIDPAQAPGVAGLNQVRFLKLAQDASPTQIITDADPANLSFPRAGYNSADPANLREFVDWAMDNFPAQRNVLVLWDHGDGWLPGAKSFSATERNWQRGRQASGILGDDVDGEAMLSDNAAVAAALSGLHFDLLCFDACNMAQIEALYEYKDVASYISASEALFPAEGYPYSAVLNAWTAVLPADAPTVGTIIADEIYNRYDGETYAAQTTVDTANLAALVSALQAVTANVTPDAAALSANVKESIGNAFEPELSDGERDLRGFLVYFRSLTIDDTLGGLLDAAILACDTAMPYFRHTGLDGAAGIAAYLPATPFFGQDYQDLYAPLGFNTATGWLGMLQATGVPDGGGAGVLAHWEPGDRIELSWADPDADIDLVLYDTGGTQYGPWNPPPPGYLFEFSEESFAAGNTYEWGRLLAGAPEGEYWLAVGMNEWNGGGPPPPTYEVSVKLYDSADALKQDLGVCTVELHDYLDYATLQYSTP